MLRIVHICPTGYMDGWGYQENLLPEYLSQEGTENHVIAPADSFPPFFSEKEKSEIRAKGDSYMVGSVRIHRVKSRQLTTSLVFIPGLKKILAEIRPDFIFHHDVIFSTMLPAASYAAGRGIGMVVDNHADELNMSRNRLWVWLYHKVLNRAACKIAGSRVQRYYGVSCSRCDFIGKYYKVPASKVSLLPIGADVNRAETIADKAALRARYGFGEGEFVVVSGGKMGAGKGTDRLIRAVESLRTEVPGLRLCLFGSFEDEATAALAKASPAVKLEGWCDRTKTLELLKLADLACWPVHHTTLIEDSVSVATPLLIRRTGTTQHLVRDNGRWLESSDEQSIAAALRQTATLDESGRALLRQGCEAMREEISYRTVALKVLNDMKK